MLFKLFIITFVIILISTPNFILAQNSEKKIYVSTKGNDKWLGTKSKPFKTFERAQLQVRKFSKKRSVRVIFKKGTYYLAQNITFIPEDNPANGSLRIYQAEQPGSVIISGGKALNLKWKPFEKGIYTAEYSNDTPIDQLYINGVKQRMARYPNIVYSSSNNVYDKWMLQEKKQLNPEKDTLLLNRIKKWKSPEGGYFHAMHTSLWGDMHWLIQGKNSDSTLQMEGGWQNNRPAAMHPLYRMVENIQEELDQAGEWFYDTKEKKIYLIPPSGVDILQPDVKVEISQLKNIITFKGNQLNPVKNIHLIGFVFKHTSRTFMENKEPLLRSDWTIYRGGSLFFEGSENCLVENCEFDQLGGNSVFINKFNKNISIKSCYIHDSGASGIAFVGNTQSVRSPLFRYGPQHYNEIDYTKGPLNFDFPQNCVVEDCLITRTGREEKQTAGIQISMSYGIQIKSCSIYDVPRAGININEGTFGGHLIEHCDIFNTVLETGDHGSFNSWGRDRFWDPNVPIFSKQVALRKDLPYLDMLAPNIIRNNRWRCDHGWDIDLDDGSSNYEIYNNLLLNGGLKLREGYHRIVKNNIIINNTLHPHVWPKNNEDVFTHNIVFDTYHTALMNTDIEEDESWGKQIDSNFFVILGEPIKKQDFLNRTDQNSIYGDPMFVNPTNGDFKVTTHSSALKLGFKNFDMNHFGVKNQNLKSKVKQVEIPKIINFLNHKKIKAEKQHYWLGAEIREPKNEEWSAYGVKFNAGGIAFTHVPNASEAAKLGFKTGDLLQKINKIEIKTINHLNQFIAEQGSENKSYTITLIRQQVQQQIHSSIPSNRIITPKL